ncbi:unnamed protein product [Urochloa humidicola]
MDLLDPASIRLAVEGAHGVFHLASPVTLEPAQDPEKELLEPAVKGTLNVLRVAKGAGVGRVVLVSSQAAMVPNPSWPADKVIDEDCWADVELLKQLQLWYHVSKTLAEKAAWSFAEEEGLHLVVLNPGMVFGPTLTPSVTCSLQLMLLLLRAIHGGALVLEPRRIRTRCAGGTGCQRPAGARRGWRPTRRTASVGPGWRAAAAAADYRRGAVLADDGDADTRARSLQSSRTRCSPRNSSALIVGLEIVFFVFLFFFEVNLELDYMGANSTRNRWQELIHWRGTSIAWELIRLEVGTTTGLQMAASTHERVADR